jgi:hypothetical protein
MPSYRNDLAFCVTDLVDMDSRVAILVDHCMSGPVRVTTLQHLPRDLAMWLS